MKKAERIGEKNINHQGLEMEIIDYKDRRNMEDGTKFDVRSNLQNL